MYRSLFPVSLRIVLLSGSCVLSNSAQSLTNCPAVLAVHKEEPSVQKFKVWKIIGHPLLKKTRPNWAREVREIYPGAVEGSQGVKG